MEQLRQTGQESFHGTERRILIPSIGFDQLDEYSNKTKQPVAILKPAVSNVLPNVFDSRSLNLYQQWLSEYARIINRHQTPEIQAHLIILNSTKPEQKPY